MHLCSNDINNELTFDLFYCLIQIWPLYIIFELRRKIKGLLDILGNFDACSSDLHWHYKSSLMYWITHSLHRINLFLKAGPVYMYIWIVYLEDSPFAMRHITVFLSTWEKEDRMHCSIELLYVWKQSVNQSHNR